MVTYKGFSTVNKKYPPFTMTDTDLIKTDIMNEFNTVMGERVMLPNFGSRIHELIMDPLDSITKDIILADVKRIIKNDPRVALIGSPSLFESDHAVRVSFDLYFIEQDQAEPMLIDFQRKLREGI